MRPSSLPLRRTSPAVLVSGALASGALVVGVLAPVGVSAAPVERAVSAAVSDAPGIDDSWPAPVVRAELVDGRATITWDAVGDESHLLGYLVDHAETRTQVDVALGQPRIATFDVVGGTNTFFVVPVTREEKLATAGSASVSAPATAPEAPLALTVSRSGRDVTLAWWAPGHDGGSPLSHYVVRAGGREWRVAAGGSPQVTLRAGADLPHGASVPVSVTAVNAVGASTAASAQAVTAPMVKPSAPRNLRVTSTLRSGKARHVVRWDAPATRADLGVAHWELKVGSRVVRVPADRTSWTVKKAPGGVRARVSLRAVNADGSGPVASVTTRTNKQKPSAARSIRVTDASGRRAAVTVRWRRASQAGTGQKLRYQVKVQRVDAAGKGVGKVVSARTTRGKQLSRTVRVARAGQYRVKVRAVTEHGKSRWSRWTSGRVTG